MLHQGRLLELPILIDNARSLTAPLTIELCLDLDLSFLKFCAIVLTDTLTF